MKRAGPSWGRRNRRRAPCGRARPDRVVLSNPPGKSGNEARQVLGDYRGTVVVDGFAVYEVLARDGPGVTLAHCLARTKRKYDEIAMQWPAACREIGDPLGDTAAG